MIRRVSIFILILSLTMLPISLRASVSSGASDSVGASASVIDVIPASASFEQWQDSEPTLAINPNNPSEMVMSTFTRNYALPDYGKAAPVFVSENGGQTWAAVPLLPGGPITADVTVRFSPTAHYLYAALVSANDRSLNVVRIPNLFSTSGIQLLYSRPDDDQPYLEAAMFPSNDGGRHDVVFVGDNDTWRSDVDLQSNTASLEIDPNLSSAHTPKPSDFSQDLLEARVPFPQDGPPVRMAVSHDGTVYVAYMSWTSKVPNTSPIYTSTVTADIVVERDNAFGRGGNYFQVLRDADDHKPGVVVAKNVTLLFDENKIDGVLGGQRIGGALSVALDPRNDNRVYVAWGDGDQTTGELHVRRSLKGGAPGSWSQDLFVQRNGVNPALAISASGTVGLLTQRFDHHQWITALFTSKSGAFDDTSVTTLSRTSQLQPIGQPLLGDYEDLQVVGDTFYGAFAANNVPILQNFPKGVRYQRYHDFASGSLYADAANTAVVNPSIDPFFFSVTGL